ncbi:MAG: helix-turn-helix domain-containing protein [Sphingobacteriaceae bacterium]|nr:helix-turn-helix domain-containing protein [Sphingobacteriaceae bacterium]
MKNEEVMAIMPQSELSQIKTDIEFIKETLSAKGEEDFTKQYIDSKKVPKLLNISIRTWQNYRDNNEIPFIQFGQKIWVKRKDLEAFLEKYYINTKQK